MAQVKLLKISSDGIPLEFTSATDEITLLSGQFGNMKLAANTLSSEDVNGDINIEPNGTGDVYIQALQYPSADGFAGQGIVTDGAGVLSFDFVDADSIVTIYTADEVLSARDVLYISAVDNVSKADVSGAGAPSRVIGVAKSAAADTAPVNVVSEGVVTGYVGLTTGERYYANPAVLGGITNVTPVGSGNSIVQIGYAKSTTELHLHIQQLGRRS